MTESRSIAFFDEQFRRQPKDVALKLNPFEELALSYLWGDVLDFGCGLGNLAFAAAGRGCAVTALDASPAAIEHIRARAAAEGACLLVSLCLISPHAALAQAQKDTPAGSPIAPLNLAASYPRSLTFVFASVLEFQAQVDAATAGKLPIRVLGSGEMLPAFGVLEAVQRGTVPMAWTAPHFFFGRDPIYGLIGQPLFSFTPSTYVAWRQRPDVAYMMDDLAARWPDDLDPFERYKQVGRWLADQHAFDFEAVMRCRRVFPKRVGD